MRYLRAGRGTLTLALLPDRDSPRYPWTHRPRDHNAAGLYTHGPQPAAAALPRLMADQVYQGPAPLSPTVARAQARIQRARVVKMTREQRRFLRAIFPHGTQ